MVAVAVGQHQVIELSVGDIVVYVVEGFGAIVGAVVVICTVDEHVLPVGEEDEDAIALSDIDEVHHEFAFAADEGRVRCALRLGFVVECGEDFVKHIGCREIDYHRRHDDDEDDRDDEDEKVALCRTGCLSHNGIISEMVPARNPWRAGEHLLLRRPHWLRTIGDYVLPKSAICDILML